MANLGRAFYKEPAHYKHESTCRARSIWDVVGSGRGGGMDNNSPVNWSYPSGSYGEEVTVRVKKSPDPTQVATNAKTK